MKMSVVAAFLLGVVCHSGDARGTEKRSLDEMLAEAVESRGANRASDFQIKVPSAKGEWAVLVVDSSGFELLDGTKRSVVVRIGDSKHVVGKGRKGRFRIAASSAALIRMEIDGQVQLVSVRDRTELEWRVSPCAGWELVFRGRNAAFEMEGFLESAEPCLPKEVEVKKTLGGCRWKVSGKDVRCCGIPGQIRVNGLPNEHGRLMVDTPLGFAEDLRLDGQGFSEYRSLPFGDCAFPFLSFRGVKTGLVIRAGEKWLLKIAESGSVSGTREE